MGQPPHQLYRKLRPCWAPLNQHTPHTHTYTRYKFTHGGQRCRLTLELPAAPAWAVRLAPTGGVPWAGGAAFSADRPRYRRRQRSVLLTVDALCADPDRASWPLCPSHPAPRVTCAHRVTQPRLSHAPLSRAAAQGRKSNTYIAPRAITE